MDLAGNIPGTGMLQSGAGIYKSVTDLSAFLYASDIKDDIKNALGRLKNGIKNTVADIKDGFQSVVHNARIGINNARMRMYRGPQYELCLADGMGMGAYWQDDTPELNFLQASSAGKGGSKRFDRAGYQSGGRSNNLFGRDRQTRNTAQYTEWRRSISKNDIHDEMRLFLGDDFVKVDAGKWRSLDGTRQFRVKPVDYLGKHPIGQPSVPNTPHVHLEFLSPRNNGNGFDVIKNIHVPLVD